MFLWCQPHRDLADDPGPCELFDHLRLRECWPCSSENSPHSFFHEAQLLHHKTCFTHERLLNVGIMLHYIISEAIPTTSDIPQLLQGPSKAPVLS